MAIEFNKVGFNIEIIHKNECVGIILKNKNKVTFNGFTTNEVEQILSKMKELQGEVEK